MAIGIVVDSSFSLHDPLTTTKKSCPIFAQILTISSDMPSDYSDFFFRFFEIVVTDMWKSQYVFGPVMVSKNYMDMVKGNHSI